MLWLILLLAPLAIYVLGAVGAFAGAWLAIGGGDWRTRATFAFWFAAQWPAIAWSSIRDQFGGD